MSNASDFVIERGKLERYLGKDTHVVVPEGVKTIGESAFRRYDKLRSVQLPESVTKIEEYAFWCCTGLQRINIPQKVKTIGEAAFRNCRNLRDITFAGEPEKIGLMAFYGCWKIDPNAEGLAASVKDFLERMRTGKLTLAEGKDLYVFSKSKGVATIKEFQGVSMLAWDGSKYPFGFNNWENSLVIPVSIGDLPVVKAPSKQIPENAIVYCGAEHFDKLPRPNRAILTAAWLVEDKMLREELEEKIKPFLKKYSADVAWALKDYDDPAVYKRFLELAKPKTDVIEKLVEQCQGKAEILAVLLGANTSGKKGGAELTLDAKPKLTVTELKKLWTYQTYTIAETGEKVVELTNYKGHDKHVEIPEYIGKTRVAVVRVVFPADVESVEFPTEQVEIKCSFRNCKAMADPGGFVVINVGGRRILTDYTGPKNAPVLTIPDGVTENTYGTFRKMEVREVILPEGFITLAGASFMDCKKLQRVHLPESLRQIGHMAFQNCHCLRQIYIPEGVTQMGSLDVSRYHNKDFVIYGKPGSKAEESANMCGYGFVAGRPDETEALPDFMVKDGVLTNYVGDAADVAIPETVTAIGTYAFMDNGTIKSLVIGDHVQEIRSRAMSNCGSLTTVKIGGGVKTIGEGAFQFTGLRWVEMAEGVQTIEKSAFAYLSPAGTEVVIPASVCRIEAEAFYSGFKSVTLRVKAGSYAETYAKENDIPFVAE